MNIFNNIPNDLLTGVYMYLDYKNLSKLKLINKRFKNNYDINKNYLHKKLIKNYGYNLVENPTSFNFQKPNYTLSVTKNKNIHPEKLLEEYLTYL